MSIFCKVCDRFGYQLLDADGEVVHEQEDGYVPDFMPGEHYGDYIILNIELDTGMVINWSKPTSEQIEKAIKPQDD